MFSTMESKPAYQENAPEPSKGERICGLSTKWFWTLVALILAICIGVGVGVGVGVTRKYENTLVPHRNIPSF